MKACNWECVSLHRGGSLDDPIWYCTSDDAPKSPLPESCHDAREGMVLDAFEYWGACSCSLTLF